MKKVSSQNANPNNQMSGNERIIDRTTQRKKKNRRKKLIFRTCLGTIFLVAGVVLVLTMFFNISEVIVTGDTVYGTEQIINSSGLKIGDNLIFISKKKINEKITGELPYIGNVEVKRHIPSKIELKVTKTEAVFAVTQNGYYTLLNENGKVLENNIEFVGENIILLNLGKITSATVGKTIETETETALEKLILIRTECKNIGLTDITSIDLSNIYNIKLVYQGRITLELGDLDNSNFSKKIALGKSAIDYQNAENELYRGTIDLTVDGKGFWSEETTTEVTTVPETTTEEPNTDSETESTTQTAA